MRLMKNVRRISVNLNEILNLKKRWAGAGVGVLNYCSYL